MVIPATSQVSKASERQSKVDGYGWEAEKSHDHGHGVTKRVYVKNGVT